MGNPLFSPVLDLLDLVLTAVVLRVILGALPQELQLGGLSEKIYSGVGERLAHKPALSSASFYSLEVKGKKTSGLKKTGKAFPVKIGDLKKTIDGRLTRQINQHNENHFVLLTQKPTK